MFKELYKAYPANVSFKNGLAISYAKLGSTHSSLGNLDSALIFFEEYNVLEKELYKAYPENVSFKKGLAISYSKLGETHTSLGNLDSALIFYKKDLVLTEELYKAYPANVSFKKGLAISYSKLGETHSSLGNLDSALIFFQIETELFKELYKAYPANVGFKNGLAISFAKLGVFYTEELEDYPKALTYFKDAEAIWIELTRDAPHYLKFQQYLNLVRQKLWELENIHITKLNEQIQAATDTLEIYSLSQKLSDTLRLKSALNPQYEDQFSQALNSKAWYGFFLKKFGENEKDIREALALSVENKYLATNLPPALLLQGKFDEAREEYLKYKDLAFGEQGLMTYKDVFLDDLNAFEKAGIIPEDRQEDVAKIRRLLER